MTKGVMTKGVMTKGVMTKGVMTRLRINGEEAEIAVSTVAELLAERGIDPNARFLAVAINGAVVRRAEWAEKPLSPGDRVEIVRPLQGG
jgi:sulfur carrier protein